MPDLRFGQDTIFAPATAPGRAAVAVVRISGPRTEEAIATLAGAPVPLRRPSLRRLRRPADGSILDEALVLRFQAPHSYTGEDAAEFHMHGGQAVVEGVLTALAELGLRLAEPGEFTRRAFQNGKLDLAQAEAVADLIDAETDAQRRQALAQLDGALSRRYEAWRETLLQTLALLEAAVDFPDEELPHDLAARARPGLDRLVAELAEALEQAPRGDRIREGYRIALVGAPNAGKSSLLNRLAGREAAIVTPTPGTTRDIIEVPLVLAGYKVLLADTAGLRTAGDNIEAEGVRRAKAWAETADLRLWIVDRSDGQSPPLPEAAKAGDLLILNKADLAPSDTPAQAGLETLNLSARTGEGLDALRDHLTRRVIADLSGAELPAATRARHTTVLRQAHAHLERARASLEAGAELAAEDVRLAARALARVSGRIDPEDVLDRVFASFCIGK